MKLREEIFKRWKRSFEILGDEYQFYSMSSVFNSVGSKHGQDREFAWRISGFSGFGIPVLSTSGVLLRPSPPRQDLPPWQKKNSTAVMWEKVSAREKLLVWFNEVYHGLWVSWFLSLAWTFRNHDQNQSIPMFKSCNVHGVHHFAKLLHLRRSSCQVERYSSGAKLQQCQDETRHRTESTARWPKWTSSAELST